MDIKECLFGKTISPCTWMQHSVIAGSIVAGAAFLLPGVEIIAALAVMFFFIMRETKGPDQHIPWYKRLVASVDRVGDWVTPTITAWTIVAIFSVL